MSDAPEDGLPSGWARVSVGEVLSAPLCNGRSVETAQAGGFPVLRLTALSGGRLDLRERKHGAWSAEDAAPFLVRAGDFFVARGNGSIRLVGRGALLDEEPDPVAFPDTLIRVRLDRRAVEPRYLSQVWHSFDVRRQLETKAKTTAGIYKVNQSDLGSIAFRVAPLAEQRRIVAALESYFSRLDDAVATLERVQRNLKRYRASVLQAAVEGRLVPTEAELARAEGRDYEPASVLLERILVERRRRWQASGQRGKYVEPTAPDTSDLPPLPEGWCWTTTEMLFWDAGYGTSQKCTYEADGPPVLRIPNVQNEAISLDDLKYATGTDALAPDGALKPGDFLFIRTNGSRNLIGRGAVVLDVLSSEHYFASYLIRLRLVPVGSTPKWLSLAWHSPVVRDRLLQDAVSSAGQHNVSLSAARQYLVPLPPAAEQARILAELERSSSIAAAAERTARANVERCARLRQSILKWAFEGKLADQDPSDEPASELLKRIAAERAAAPAKRRR